MAVIDDKVVAMSFENSKFQAGVSTTIASLEKLKSVLNFGNAGKGLSDLHAAGKRVDLSHIGAAVDNISSRLSLLGVAGAAVFASLALQAFHAATNMAKAFTLGPIHEGYGEYITKLNAIQTILSNTAAAGTTLNDVVKALKELNEYSDKTIYNFGQMARNIGTFTAAGVDLNTSVDAIKGIANLAALSGSNADQASRAMYQLSQAVANGTVRMIDWISVNNAGMGGAVFQRQLAETAVAMGTLDEKQLKLVGSMKNVKIAGQSFRESLSGKETEGWLSAKVLTATLAQFTGDLSEAELAAQGFTGQQIRNIQKVAKSAVLAATQVKDFFNVMKVAKETAGSGWSETFEIVLGTYTEAKATFTNLSTTINGFINKSAEARNKVLGDWKALGGRRVLINSIKTAFENLMAILGPIKAAFRDIFPAKTAEDLFKMTYQFKHFAESLKASPETIENLKRTFRGIFALFSIGISIIKGIHTVFKQMFGSVSESSGGFLNFTGSVGDFLVALDKAIKKGVGFNNFFVTLGNILAKPIELLSLMSGALSGMFKGFFKSSGGFTGQIDGMASATSSFSGAIESLAGVWESFIGSFSGGGDSMQGFTDGLVKAIQAFGPALSEATQNMNFELILNAIRTGFFGALVLMIKRFLGPGSVINQLFGKKGILGNISQSFGALTSSMQAMTNNIRADTLQKIAIAIGILTLSIVALSFVDPKRLISSLTAISVGFAILVGALTLLSTATKGVGFIKMPFIAASLILLAGAIVILSAAVIMLSVLSWEQLLKGLTGVGVLLAVIVLAVKPLSAASPGMIKAGIGIMAIAGALLVLSVAVQIMGRMDMVTLGKGLGGIAAGLILMTFAMTKMPVVPLRSSIGILAMAGALVILATAVQIMGRMDLLTLGKGLGGIAAGLILMVFAMTKMPATSMLKNAAALMVMSVALQGIAFAIKMMGNLSLDQIAKGLGTLYGSMVILAASMKAMTGTTGGAFALTAAVSALALLAPVLIALGKQSWTQIIKGLVSLGAAMLIIGIAGKLMTPAVPALLGFGVALVLIGAGLALAGAGIALIGIGLAAITVAVPTAIGILIAAILQFLEAMPRMVLSFVDGLLVIVKAFSDIAPQFVNAMLKILEAMLDGVIESVPKISEAFVALMIGALKAIHDHAPKIIQAGFKLLQDLLQGIKNNIPKIVPVVADIIARFLTGLANNISKIVAAGVTLLLAFLKGIADAHSRIITAVVDIIVKFIGELSKNWEKIRKAGTDLIVKFIEGIAKSYKDIIKAGTDAIVSFVTGIGEAGERIVTAARVAAGKFIKTLAKQIVALADDVFDALITLINGMADVIEARDDELRKAGKRLGWAILNGMTLGLGEKAQDLYNKAGEIAGKVLSILKKPWNAFSPSRTMVELGGNIVAGLTRGLDVTAPQAFASAAAMSNGVINAFRNTFQITSPSKIMMDIGKLVGQGFAQGLRGSSEDIRGAFTELNEKLTEAMVKAREIIASEQEKLDKLRASKKPDAEAIKAAQRTIAENELLLKQSTATRIILVKSLSDEKTSLIKLANEFDSVTTKLEKAKEELIRVRQIRDDFSAQYSTTPDISDPMIREIADARARIADERTKLDELLNAKEQDAKAIESANVSIAEAMANFDTLVAGKVLNVEGTAVDQLATYMQALTYQTQAVGAYGATLEQLRKLGLDDATYQKLLTEGTADQSFATQLLSGGKTAVIGLNKLDRQLATESLKLATNATANLHKGGVKAAEGLIKGLASKRSAIRKEMEEIAQEMLRALRRELKMKSPSQAFAEIGSLSMEGMALGFSNSSKIVKKAIDDAAAEALSSMRQSMRNISNIVSDELNPNPVITPILDLTQVRSRARELAELANVVPITAASSFGQASSISSEQTTRQAEELAAMSSGTSVTFEQNNYSPEALTEVEIYRQTRNQLSQLKSVLAT